MSSEEQPEQSEQPSQPQRPQEPEVPEDAIEVAQVQYAWLWSSWWLLAIIVILTIGIPPIIPPIFPDPFTPSVLVFIVLIPKYWQWRRTRYYLTEDALIYQRGGILQTRRYQIPFARLKDTRVRHGMFGRALGFQHVDIMLENGAIATLIYVPAQMDVADYFRKRITVDTSDEATDEGTVDESPSDESK